MEDTRSRPEYLRKITRSPWVVTNLTLRNSTRTIIIRDTVVRNSRTAFLSNYIHMKNSDGTSPLRPPLLALKLHTLKWANLIGTINQTPPNPTVWLKKKTEQNAPKNNPLWNRLVTVPSPKRATRPQAVHQAKQPPTNVQCLFINVQFQAIIQHDDDHRRGK